MVDFFFKYEKIGIEPENWVYFKTELPENLKIKKKYT